MNAKTRQRGLTLIEITIASVILLVVVGIAISLIITSQDSYTQHSISSDLENRGRKLAETYMLEWQYAKLRTISPDGSSITWQVAVGNFDDGSIKWGYQGNVGWFAGLAFLASDVIRQKNGPVPTGYASLPTIYDSAGKYQWDNNNNGANDMTFIRGKLGFQVFDASSVPQESMARVDDLLILRYVSSTAINGDMDGDGGLDPLFAILDANGNVLSSTQIGVAVKMRVDSWHGNFDELRKKFLMRDFASEMKLMQ